MGRDYDELPPKMSRVTSGLDDMANGGGAVNVDKLFNIEEARASSFTFQKFGSDIGSGSGASTNVDTGSAVSHQYVYVMYY